MRKTERLKGRAGERGKQRVILRVGWVEVAWKRMRDDGGCILFVCCVSMHLLCVWRFNVGIDFVVYVRVRVRVC